MRSRKGLFWRSLFLTLLVLVPMSAAVLFFSGQRQRQAQLELAAAAGRGEVGVDAGAQNTHRILLAVQNETPEFLLLRIDAPARTITFCAVPGQTQVDAPQGSTTLADCYLTAGPARAAQLLASTLETGPDAYFAATPDTYAELIGGDATATFDTAAVLSLERRRELGYGEDHVAELTPADTETFLQTLRPGMTVRNAASLRAAVWSAYLRQNPARLSLLVDAAREQSARTLTDLTAQDLQEIGQTLAYLADRTETTVEYTVLSGAETPAGYLLDGGGVEQARELLD
ncbi:MAG TPA: hypothetical protein H9915_08670 [Candidatus Gemmiger faecigallinarum]|nr:hypothetical protein [Candidatus Gemmiger faecigallinarum]